MNDDILEKLDYLYYWAKSHKGRTNRYKHGNHDQSRHNRWPAGYRAQTYESAGGRRGGGGGGQSTSGGAFSARRRNLQTRIRPNLAAGKWREMPQISTMRYKRAPKNEVETARAKFYDIEDQQKNLSDEKEALTKELSGYNFTATTDFVNENRDQYTNLIYDLFEYEPLYKDFVISFWGFIGLEQLDGLNSINPDDVAGDGELRLRLISAQEKYRTFRKDAEEYMQERNEKFRNAEKQIQLLAREKHKILRDLYDKHNETPEYVVPDNPSTGEDVAQMRASIVDKLISGIPDDSVQLMNPWGLNSYIDRNNITQNFAPYLQSLSRDQQMQLIDADMYDRGSESHANMRKSIEESLRARMSISPENEQNADYVNSYNSTINEITEKLSESIPDEVADYLMKFGHPDVRMELVKRGSPIGNPYTPGFSIAYPFTHSSISSTSSAQSGAGVDLMVQGALNVANENDLINDEFSQYYDFIEKVMFDHALSGYRLTTAHIQQLFTQIGPAQKMDGVVPNFFPPGITPPAPNAQAVKWMQQFYAEQQGRFMIDGVDSIQLYRGTKFKLGLPMESWSTMDAIAFQFSSRVNDGSVYSVNMPVDYIWGTYLSIFNWPENRVLGKEEYVVAGWPLINGEDGNRVQKIKEPRYQATGKIDINQNFDDYDIYSRWYEDSDDSNDDDKLTDIVARAKALSVSNLDKQSLLFDRIRQLSSRK
jgi:hypothetical protein